MKPNTNVVEHGILLLPYSNVAFDQNSSTLTSYSFDGRFYVNILIGSNVPTQEIFTITVTGTTYARNVDGSLKYDNNGNIVIERVISKDIDVTVNPAPSLSLAYLGDEIKGYIYQTNENTEEFVSYGEYNLTYLGQKLEFQAKLENGLIANNNPELIVEIYDTVALYELSKENPLVSKQTMTLHCVRIVNDTYFFELNTSDFDFEQGNIIVVQSKVKRTSNGFEETYSSQKISHISPVLLSAATLSPEIVSTVRLCGVHLSAYCASWP